jgi:hypothetical protein
MLRDCLTRWIWLLMTCNASSRPKKGTRPVFKLCRCSNAFITQKVHFSRLMRVYVGLIMLVQVSFASYWSAGFGTFLQVSAVVSHWLEDTTNVGGKRPIQRQPLFVQCKKQDNLLLSMHNYTPLVISRNDQNNQLTL